MRSSGIFILYCVFIMVIILSCEAMPRGRNRRRADPDSDEEDSSRSVKIIHAEVSAKTIIQMTSNGSVAISEVSKEGKFILIEKSSSGADRQDLDLEGWMLKQVVDGKRTYIYTFGNVILKPGKSLKIFALGSAAEAGINDLIFREEDTWGVGSHIVTSLLNEKEEEEATHTQKTL